MANATRGGAEITLEDPTEHLEMFTNSQLVASQVDGGFEAREPNMVRYLAEAHRLVSMIKYFNISHTPRIKNSRVDALARSASAGASTGAPSRIANLHRPIIATIEVATTVANQDW
ncbi:hypothetical protein BHM03_00027635 [Ensete ventricosum]|nr:hypothetical protein BHM03_00027635 [Ensete ventricosum]